MSLLALSGVALAINTDNRIDEICRAIGNFNTKGTTRIKRIGNLLCAGKGLWGEGCGVITKPTTPFPIHRQQLS